MVKTGISGGKVSKTDKSYRATGQVNKLNKTKGTNKYDSKIVEKIPAGNGARKKVLDAEKKNADKNRKTLDPEIHKTHNIMNLRYINLWLSPESGYDDDYRYEFKLHTRFINHFLSTQIRKYKYSTDGSFNMISIAPKPNKIEECRIVPLETLRVEVPFNKSRYDQIKGTENSTYYLELFEEGFKKASKFKQIPLKDLLNLLKEFQKNGCKNEWMHKKKKFKEQDVEVELECYFTTLDFRLIATINQISTKKQLCRGTIIRTKPDEIYFDKMFKDILIQKNFIIVTDASDSARVLINIEDAKKGTFNKMFAPYIYNEDYTIEKNKEFEDTHNHVVKMLSYRGNNF